MSSTRNRLWTLLATTTCFAMAANIPVREHQAWSSTHWSYDDQSSWVEHFASCGGQHQSPINLDINTATIVNYPKFNFGNYDKVFSEMVTNNGHTVVMKFEKVTEDVPFLEGGGLPGRYNFAQLHFHWGEPMFGGSEHLIGSFQYPAELHIVHYNAKYGNFSNAVPFDDGLAVLGIMIELEARDNIAFRHLEHFQGILTANENKTSHLPYTIPLSDLLPDSTDSFYRYSGSLTTPGCNEDVIWTIFDTPIAISERQLNKFRTLRDPEGRPLENNFRPIQELHDREVSYRPDDTLVVPTEANIFSTFFSAFGQQG